MLTGHLCSFCIKFHIGFEQPLVPQGKACKSGILGQVRLISVIVELQAVLCPGEDLISSLIQQPCSGVSLGLVDAAVENTWAQSKGRAEPPSLEAAWTVAAELHSKSGSVQGF